MGLSGKSTKFRITRFKPALVLAVGAFSLAGCETMGEIGAAYLDQAQQTQKTQSQAIANCRGSNNYGYNYWDSSTGTCEFAKTNEGAKSKSSCTDKNSESYRMGIRCGKQQ